MRRATTRHRSPPHGGPLLATVATIVVLTGAAACDAPAPAPDPGPPVIGFDTVASPAAAGSGEPNLVVDDDGVAYLSWLEPSETGHALRFARWDGDGWGEPRTVVDRPDLFVNWADFPSLAVFDDSVLAAHWLQMSGPGTYTYDVRMALSTDGGTSWSEDIVPHRDGAQAEHGFVSLVPLGDRLAVLWLDGRATVAGDPMTLRFTTVDASGALGSETRLDAGVCDCCQTAMAPTTDGLVAAYRDRTADEVRDIYAARYIDGAWTDGRPVHRDGWVIPGCPVNGPSLATRGDTVAVAWFTAAETGDTGEDGRTLAAFSADGGASFGPPVRVDDGGAMGRVDVIAVDGRGALVSWLERTDAGAEVRVRRVEPDGVGPAFTVAGAAAARAAGFPRMVRAGDRVLFAWTATGEIGGVRTATARLPDAGTGQDEEDR
ncbi:MAG: exo-alpha-sialidase [Candidatus Longimicrobiales bacterium M2_2A_002]